MVRIHKGRESYVITLDLSIFLCKYHVLHRTVGGINEIQIPNCGLQHPVLSDLNLPLTSSQITPLQPHWPSCLGQGCPAGSWLHAPHLSDLQVAGWLPPSLGSGLCSNDPSSEPSYLQSRRALLPPLFCLIPLTLHHFPYTTYCYLEPFYFLLLVCSPLTWM